MQVGPQPLGLVVGGDADDGPVLPGKHPRAHRHVRRGDVRADDGQRRALAHVLGEGREHDARPDGAPAPQKAPCEGVAPGEVVDGAGEAGEQRGGLVAVELHAAPVQDVEHLYLHVGRHEGVALLGQHLEGLRHRLGGAAVARPHGGVHDDDERAGILGWLGRGFGAGARCGSGLAGGAVRCGRNACRGRLAAGFDRGLGRAFGGVGFRFSRALGGRRVRRQRAVCARSASGVPGRFFSAFGETGMLR